ncbi:MAG: biopolymer transporter ExbD [Candidatus Omnitrophica bacterium]|nr:biopolymer transporter ExbD [Candidatus Omnitrophota bacterium]
MNFRRHLKVSTAFGFNIVPLVNVVFLLLIFLLLASSFTARQPINVRLPKAVTSDIVNNDNITVVITAENIFYYHDKVITLGELKALLQLPQNRQRPVLIKADRRASLGRVVDIWDLGRGLGIGRINVATDQEE